MENKLLKFIFTLDTPKKSSNIKNTFLYLISRCKYSYVYKGKTKENFLFILNGAFKFKSILILRPCTIFLILEDLFPVRQ